MASSLVLYGPRNEVISSPQIRRERQQQAVRARFDAAQTTNENQRHWANADYLGPNAELDPGVRRKLRSRARYECANNTYASGMLRSLSLETIGTGPSLQVADRNINKEDAAEIEEEFWQWCLAANLPQKLRLMRQAKARDGESFAQFFTNPRINHRVRLDLALFEADLVASNYVDNSLRNLLDGLILDDFRNVIAYNVLREHPGEGQSANIDGDLVPSRDIIHLFNSDRPGQFRGVPEITPALPLYAQLRRYTLAVIRSAEIAAAFSWLLKTQQSPSEMEFGEAWDALDVEHGMGTVLPEGYEPFQFKAEQPTGTYAEFKREIIAEIARCLSMPYNVAAGDSSSYNYSSGRLDHRTFYKSLRVERSMFECKAIDRCFAYWWEEATHIAGYLPESLYRAPLPRHEWRWDGDEHVDPTKEADAQTIRLTNLTTTLADECAKEGKDWNQVLRQRAAEFKAMAELGIAVSGAAAPVVRQPDQPEEPAARPYRPGRSNAV